MKANTYLALYWLAIIFACIAAELTDWLRLGEHDFEIWVVGFMARVLFYLSVSLFGCVKLINLLIKLKIK